VTDFKDVIFTNIDESIQHGSIYNFMTRFHVGIHSFGCGPKVPEDYEVASRERLLDLIFKLSKMSKT
jgi:flagellar biosynthesis protein FlhF